jgi:hypothetical protein
MAKVLTDSALSPPFPLLQVAEDARPPISLRAAPTSVDFCLPLYTQLPTAQSSPSPLPARARADLHPK